MALHYENMTILSNGFRCTFCGMICENYVMAKNHRQLCSRKQQNI